MPAHNRHLPMPPGGRTDGASSVSVNSIRYNKHNTDRSIRPNIPSKWDDQNLKYAVRAPTFNETIQIPEEYTGLNDLVKCLGSQGNVGSCTGWAGAALKKAIIFLNDNRQVLPSAGSIYWRSRQYNNPPIPENIEGSYPISIMK